MVSLCHRWLYRIRQHWSLNNILDLFYRVASENAQQKINMTCFCIYMHIWTFNIFLRLA